MTIPSMQNVNFKVLCIAFVILIFRCSFIAAQINLYPASYGLINETKGFFNPALTNLTGKFSFTLGNQYFPGTYSQLENHFFQGTINLSHDTAKNKNNLGIKLVTEKEGDYIRRSKAYLLYAFHIPVFRDYFLSAGADIGFAGYTFKATNVSAEGSDIAPDADIALGLHNRTLVIGIAMNQALNSTLTPKQQEFRYKRFYTLYLEKKLNINENLSLIFNYQFENLKGYHQFHTLGTRALVSRVVEVGMNVLPMERWTFLLGLSDIHFEKHRFRLIMGYNVPLRIAAQSNIQSFEIMLTYFHL